jgi:hypothetical protein
MLKVIGFMGFYRVISGKNLYINPYQNPYKVSTFFFAKYLQYFGFKFQVILLIR